MANDRGGELRALRRVIETCRAQAVGLDMPALIYLLREAELSVSAHAAAGAAPEDLRGAAPSVSRPPPLRH